jgi:large subunit ribosomal protein L14
MLLAESLVKIDDNTGAAWGRCIRIMGTGYRKVAFLGDYLVIALPHRHRVKRLLSRNIYLGILLQTKINQRRFGYYIRGMCNKVALLSADHGRLIGSMIHGVFFREVFRSNLVDLITLTRRIV